MSETGTNVLSATLFCMFTLYHGSSVVLQFFIKHTAETERSIPPPSESPKLGFHVFSVIHSDLILGYLSANNSAF